MDNLLKITLLCTSDVHGYYMPWDYAKDEETKFGGLTRVSTIVNNIRKENPHTVLIDNGDLIQGNNAEFFLKNDNYPGIEVINKMKYDIYNMGNHEFNFGMDTLIKVVSKFNEICMMGNLYRKKNTMRFMNGIYYMNFGQIRIGFISLNTPLVRRFEAKRGNLKYYDVIDADFELKKLLKEVGKVDALIGLFHMGDFNENDIKNTGVKDLLKNVEGSEKIDAVFGGHMHQILNIKIGDVNFLEPGAYAKGLSKMDLFFNKSTHELIKIKSEVIKIDDSIEQDKEIVDILKPYHNKLREYINEKVGYVSSPLFNDDEIKGIPQTRVAQTFISDFFADVMLDISGADVVAFHFDNLYPKIMGPKVRRKDIFDSYRYAGGEITKFEITGKDLRDYMEWSAGYFNQFKDDDVNISFDFERTDTKYSTFDIFGNVKYEIDITKPKGNRIKNLRKMDNSIIHDDEIIEIGMNKYRMDFLTSNIGPLKNRKFKITWTSIKNPELNIDGNIRNLSIMYLQKLENNTYISKINHTWKLSISNKNYELRKRAIQLINEGSLIYYKNDEGENNLNKPLNLNDKLEYYQLEKLREKYDISDNKILKDILKEIF